MMFQAYEPRKKKWWSAHLNDIEREIRNEFAERPEDLV